MGEFDEPAENFDLMTVLILRLGKDAENSKNDKIRLLSVLLSATTKPVDKKRILYDEFNISLTKDFGSEVCDMCKGIEQGIEQGIEKGKILGAMEALSSAGFNQAQITDMLLKQFKISRDETETLMHQQLR